VDKLHCKAANEASDRTAELCPGDFPANTAAMARRKGQMWPTLVIDEAVVQSVIQPTLRDEVITVCAPDISAPVQGVKIDKYMGTFWDAFALNGGVAESNSHCHRNCWI
jgi:hypothetical protein